jgi:TonB-dependent starch-binding outer membrane protein SusC
MYKINAKSWRIRRNCADSKPILIMKLSLILILMSMLKVQAFTFAQKLTLHKRNASLNEVFSEIRKQTGYNILYTASVLSHTKSIDVDLRDATVEEAIRKCLANQPLTYKIVEKNIVISRKENTLNQVQDNTISGTVKDENGKELSGVSISIKGVPNRGTQTNDKGVFTLSAPKNATIIVSSIGFIRQEIRLGDGQISVAVQLVEDDAELDEVVVIGYGTQRKSDLTGAVSSVSSEKIAAFPVAGTAQALQGRSPGVAVSSVNGEPGKAPRVRIRGGTSINASSDPLYVVDGFAGGTPPPPEDVESVEVLKDASATAIYGSRGANGVIMVTTKKGKVGRPIIDFNNSYSFQHVGKRLDLLNGKEFAEYINDIYKNSGNTTVPYPDPASYGEGTDWQDLIFRTGGLVNNQLAVSGGSENIRYYTSLSHYGQKGTVINSDFRRLSGTSNLDIKVSDRVRLGTKMFFIRNKLDGVRTQETSSGTSSAGVISAALRFEPVQGIYDNNGKYTLKQVGDPHDNPVAVARERKNEVITDLFQGNAYGEVELLTGLKFRSTLGVQISNRRTGNYVTKELVEGRNYGGTGSITAHKNTNVINENFLTYTKTFQQNHNLDVMGGYSYQSSRNEEWAANNRDFVSDNFSFWNLGAGSNYQRATSDLEDWVMSSFYGRANYNFKSKYFLTITGRYDGSSRFGDNNKWAFFPSGALAWNISQEPFMEEVEAISNLKIRTSYGETGNTEIGSYRSLARFSPTLTTINGVPVNAVRPTNVANPSLTWETTKQTDVGLDIGFLNGRINLAIDYYYKKTVDLLYEVPLPIYSGYTTSLQNIGSVENKGWEFAGNTTNLKGDFTWTTDFNITFNRNKILALPGGDIRYNTIPGHMLSTESQILRVGEVVGAFYGWMFDGLYQEGDDFTNAGNKKPGDVKYKDIYGRDANNNLIEGPNGVVNADDRTIIGNPHPDFIYGINNDFKYKNFDLNIFFQGSYGNDMLNITRMELDWMAGKGNATTDALNRWTPQNTNTDVPRASASNNPEVSSRWVENGSYLRLKNVALGYNFPQFALGKLRVSRLRIYASAQNILTFTKYKGFDPEVSFEDSNRNVGLDYMGYPNIKSVTVGINVGF